jgi:hypothetical protein
MAHHGFRGLRVEARPDEEPERLVRRFMRRVRDSGIHRERPRFHLTGSQRRRAKDARARHRGAQEARRGAQGHGPMGSPWPGVRASPRPSEVTWR